ncbi:MAG: hypothetical protein AAF950_00130 [Pseudomonadota bacterium]
MKRNALPIIAAATMLTALPASAHHEYSSDGTLLSLANGWALAVIALGVAGFVASRLIAGRGSR